MQSIEDLNPIFESKKALGTATFYSLRLLLDGTDDYYKDNKDGTGLVSGNLAEDLGPVEAGQNVVLRYNGDNVTVEIWDDERDEDVEVYKFRVLLEKPTIIEYKNRMR